MRVGIAADHGGFDLKTEILLFLQQAGYQVTDFGAFQLDPQDDYPDFAIPLAKAVSEGQVARGILICGSGVGACIAANKIAGARAALIHDTFSAHQGVEDDDMNILCLGGRVIGNMYAIEIVQTFLSAHFKSNVDRFQRRLAKVIALETK